MKTTIDFPEDLLHRAKIKAAEDKVTLKELVIRGLEYATTHPSPVSDSIRTKRAEKLIASLARGRNQEAIKPFSRDEIYADRWKTDLR